MKPKIVTALLFLLSLPAVVWAEECTIKAGGFVRWPGVTITDPALQPAIGEVNGQSVIDLGQVAVLIYGKFAHKCDKTADGTTRSGWEPEAFPKQVVTLNGGERFLLAEEAIKRMHAPGIKVPGYEPALQATNANANAPDAEPIVATPQPASTCTFCKDVRNDNAM